MPSHVAVQNPPPFMRDDKEAVQYTKCQRWHGEEIHRGYRFTMIVQKRSPPFCWLRTPRCFPHPTQDSSFRNIEAQHLQLTMNSRRSPNRVLGYHAEDEFTQLLADAPSSSTGLTPREPRPIQLEPSAMPAHDRLRLDKNQCLLPPGPKTPQHHPEQFVRRGKPRLRMPPLQDGKLLPKNHIFQEQITTRTKSSDR
jgi:hypothetical protein